MQLIVTSTSPPAKTQIYVKSGNKTNLQIFVFVSLAAFYVKDLEKELVVVAPVPVIPSTYENDQLLE